MLSILWGLAGSGKSHVLLHEMTARAQSGERQYLLVPEQFSHEQERALSQCGGAPLSGRVEVLTFGRLADRVLSETGGCADTVLDEGGRLLLLRRAVDAVADQLTVWRQTVRRTDCLQLLLQTVDECKSYMLSPEALAQAQSVAEGHVGAALSDLALILTAYGAMLGGTVADPRDKLTRACLALPRSTYGVAHWMVDGFARFTAQEKELLRRFLKGGDVTVALTGLPEEGSEGRFAVARRTAKMLTRMAGQAGVPVTHRVLTETPRYDNPALAHLSRHFLKEEGALYKGRADRVETAALEDRRAECLYACARVRSLVCDEGYRYRDIAVVARQFDDYRALMEQAALRFDLPVFLDRKEEVLRKPLYHFLHAALESVLRGCPPETVFPMLKTGLFGLTWEECDKLENYVLAHRIRGSSWRAEADWVYPPSGYGREAGPGEEALLKELNDLRRRVSQPLEELRRRASKQKTARGQAEAVYLFLERIELPGRLRARCATLRDMGIMQRADEYEQMWDILTAALDQCVALLEDQVMALDEFSEMLMLVLSQYDVGSIPVSLDRLACGGADRVRRRQLRCVIVLGATDTSMPQPPATTGLMGREERMYLREFGIELSPEDDERMDQELDIIYGAFTLPSERLIVTWPRMGSEGAENHPSFAVTALQDMLGLDIGAPCLPEEVYAASPTLCFEWLAGRPEDPFASEAAQALCTLPDWGDRLRRVLSRTENARGALTADGVRKLYGEAISLSASRVETFIQCHYAYFLKYGLRANPRRHEGFSVLDRGNFVHHVLEETLRAVTRRGGLPQVTDEQVCELSRRAAQTYIRQVLRDHAGQSVRFRRLFVRLMRAVDTVVLNVVDELRRSAFTPFDMELRFADGVPDALPAVPAGTAAKVTGVADRVDGWIEGDALYVRVVDYKTGRRKFNLSDLYNGLGLQMFLYLFALEREGLSRYGHLGVSEIRPAGVLYLPAREAFMKTARGASDEDIRKAMAEELRRSGLVLDDPVVIHAMEQGIEGKAEYIPVKFKAGDGGLTADSSVASLERFGRLRRHVERLLSDMEATLRAGDVSAHPTCQGPKTACDHCDYRVACQFDERAGDKRRLLPTWRGEAFWEKLKEEVE